MTKLKIIAAVIASVVLFTNVTNAQTLTVSHAVMADEPLKVKYLGEDASFLLFKVTLQSDNPANAFFAIDNKDGGLMYSSKFKTTFSEQTVKILKREEDQVLHFNLFLGKKKYSKTFHINISLIETTTVAERDISKL